MKNDTPDKMFTVNRLKSRGWTEVAVRRFLGEPDARSANRYYPVAASVKYYDQQRVLMIEASREFRAWLAVSALRQVAARRRGKSQVRLRMDLQQVYEDVRQREGDYASSFAGYYYKH